MIKRARQLGWVLAFASGLAITLPACFVESAEQPVMTTPTAAAPVATSNYYKPLYYNGYVVYYDTVGRPLYYVNGGTYYVPPSYLYYNRYVSHYRMYRPYYQRWYRSSGHRYRGYRQRGYRRGVRSPRHRQPAGHRGRRQHYY